MKRDEILELKPGDIFSYHLKDSHNDRIHYYRVERVRNEGPIAPVVIVSTIARETPRSIHIIQSAKQLGYSFSDDEIRYGKPIEKTSVFRRIIIQIFEQQKAIEFI